MAVDALSGDNIQLFRSCCPQVDPQGTAVSPEVVLDAVLLQDPDWMAKDWTELWAFYLGQALADSTKKSYKSAKNGTTPFVLRTILPVCEQSLSRYAASLANKGLAHASIKCYMSAVRHLQIEEGWGDPKLKCMPKLELVLRGIKRVHGRKCKPSPRQPITPELQYLENCGRHG